MVRGVCESERNRSTAQEIDSQGLGKARTGWTQNLFYMSEEGVSTPMLALRFSRSGRMAATALEQKGLTQYRVKFFAGFILEFECSSTRVTENQP